MRLFKKSLVVIFCSLLLIGCGEASFKKVTIRFYGWAGDSQVNAWLDGYVSEQLEKNYNINFERVGMEITEIINLLVNEKTANKSSGDIDIIWINGANFAKAKEYGILKEIDTDKIENYSKNISADAPYLYSDFGEEIENYEVPFGNAQFVYIANTELITVPTSSEELLEVAKNNPGTITYPSTTDFTGSAFVRNICYDIVGYENISNASEDMEELRKLLMPAFDYLNELEPYLWQEGKTYPKEEAMLQEMYANEQLSLTMSYTALLAPRNIYNDSFSESSKTFVFENGNLANSHYLAIPFNSQNTEEAYQVINFLLSAQAQASKMELSNWGDLPVLTYDSLSEDDKLLFDDVYNSFDGEVDVNEITKNSLPEVSGKKTLLIDKLWEEEVLNK